MQNKESIYYTTNSRESTRDTTYYIEIFIITSIITFVFLETIGQSYICKCHYLPCMFLLSPIIWCINFLYNKYR